MRRTCIMAAIALFVIPTILWAQTLRLATLDWEPYAGQASDNKGFNADIVTEAFKRAGYQVKIDVLPWDRAIEEAMKGNYDGVFPEYYSKERARDFVYSHSFSDSLLVFYKRYETSVTYKTLKDLRPYKIGTVRGQINTDEFDNAVYLMKIEADSDEENLRKLAKGDLDLIVIDKFVAQYLTKTKVPEAAGKISPIEPPLIIRNLFVILPKKNPDSERRARGFNKALESMIKDGTVKAIMTGAGLTK
ncbi:MAG: transporter substrate-binding domain-containing protein [Desulfobacterota bacterium]|nr:transporter substrate-binding domain-containing protein [Thermodesulfobacteriota bacterium]